MTHEVKDKVYDINLVVEDIKKFQQTYDTILQHEKKNGTFQTILRRKLSNLCKDGDIFKTNIPGTRFGKIIFYHEPKKYHILVEGVRMGSNVFCFFKYDEVGKHYINIKNYWQLKGGLWVEGKDKMIFSGNVLNWL